jgi:hypothetical protein
MALPASLDLKTTYRLDLTTEKFYFEDITPYVGEGIALSNVEGIFTVTDPTGAKIYENIDFSDPVDLRAFEITGVNQGSKTFTIEEDIDFKLAAGTTFEITDSTGNNGTYTIVSFTAVASESVITVAETIPDATVDGDVNYFIFPPVEVPKDAAGNLILGIYTIKFTIQVVGGVQPGIYSITKTFDFCYEAPIVSITQAISCACSELTSTDTTDYSQLATGTINETVTRVHTIVPPAGSGLSNTVGSTAVLVATPISTKTWATTISTTVLYEYDDEFFIQDLLTGSEEIVVNCDQSLCDAFCCIAKLEQDYQNALTLNLNTADTLYQKLVEVTIYMVLFSSALTCGRGDDATDYFNQILEISNCEPGCSCDSPDPTVIVPTCAVAAGGTTVVVAGTKITVTSNVVGDTTTYTVSIDATTSAKIDLLRNSIVDAGTGISVVASAPDLDGTITYTVSSTVVNAQIPAMTIRLAVTTPNIRGTGTMPIYGAALNDASDILTTLYFDTSKFSSPPTVEYESPKSGDGSLSFMDITSLNNDDNVRIKVDNFLNTTTDAFTFNASVSVKGLYDSIIATPFEVVTHYQQDDALIIKLIDTQTGNEIQWYDLIQMLDSTQTLIFQINIYAQTVI